MSIDAVAPTSIEPAPIASSSIQPTGVDFMKVLTDGIAQVDGNLTQADQQLRALAAGQDIPIHDLMITMERARMGLTLMAEIRNRVVEGYQELTRMQL